MALLLDTTTISWILKGDERVGRHLEHARDSAQVYTTVITEGELAFGAMRLGRGRRLELQDAIASILVSLSGSLPVTRSAALAYAAIRRELQLNGLVMGANDLWIAAIARDAGHTLVTSDKAFWRIDNLQVEDWLEPI